MAVQYDTPLPVKVVIVDDSRTQRAWLRTILAEDARFQVVGEAATAQDARSVIKTTNPDVITLDIEMPHMDGLEFLRRLMRLRPMPVIMVSGAARPNSTAAIQALALGAVDYLSKPNLEPEMSHTQMCERIYAAAKCQVDAGVDVLERAVPVTHAAPDTLPIPGGAHPLIIIGASTGGVAALETVLSVLPKELPPILIAQHMPVHFLASFASRLHRLHGLEVCVAEGSTILRPGTITFAEPRAEISAVSRHSQTWRVAVNPTSAPTQNRPSIDALFHSASPWAPSVLAVVMTGIGDDGADGLARLSARGAQTIVQSPRSSVAPGMPTSARNLDTAAQVVDLPDLAQAIVIGANAASRKPRK